MILKPRPFTKPRTTKDVVGFWLMNEGDGDKAFDLSGNGLSLDFNAGPVWSSGKYGSSILFDDASSQYLQKDRAAILNYPLTMCGWIKADASVNHTILWIGDKDVSTDMVGIRIDSTTAGAYSYNLSEGFKESTIAGATVGEWHFIVGVFKSASSRIVYLNNIAGTEETTTVTPGTWNRTCIGRLGDDTPGGYWSGLIDNVRIYNRALNLSEITRLCREPFWMFERDPIELWAAASGAAPGISMPLVMQQMNHFSGGMVA